MTNRTSLLLDLNEGDFETILIEFEYIFTKKYLCNYVIDVYEINEFCYPLGTRIDDHKSLSKSIGYIADEQYTFNRFFDEEKSKVILLDEYIPELLSLKKIIKATTIEANHAAFNLRQYYSLLDEDIPKFDIRQLGELREIIRIKLAQVLSIILDTDNMGFQKIITLINKGKILYSLAESQSEDEYKYDIFKEAFENHRGSSLTQEIFNKLLDLDTRSDQENSNLKASAHFRDARVIDRIATINNYLLSAYNHGKAKELNLIYYFSSSPKSSRLFNEKEIIKNFPIIDGKRFNPLRNKKQLFLKYLCLAKTYNDSIHNVNFLRKRLLEIKALYSQSELDNQKVSATIIDALKGEYNHYREYFENNAILNKYSKIKSQLEAATKLLQNKSNSSDFIVKIAQYIIKVGEETKETTIDKINSLDDWAIQMRYSVFMNSYLSDPDEREVRLRVSTGKDIIRGTIHHLPLLINFTDTNLQKQFEPLLNKLLFPQNEIKIDPSDKIFPREKTEAISAKIKFYEEKLFKAFVLLLVPEEVFPNENLNELTCEWITSVLLNKLLAKKRSSKFEFIITNYYYFIGWTMRRCNQIEPSIKWFNDAIKKFPNDGRFYHGLCLSEYCQYDLLRKKGDAPINLLSSAIANAQKAMLRYTDNYPEYRKSKTALNNTLSFFYAEIFKSDSNKISSNSLSILKEARKHIENVKNEEGLDYKKYPEYLHTEAIVYLNEFKRDIILYQQNQDNAILDLAFGEIDSATTLIIDSVDIESGPIILGDKKQYHKDQSEIIKEKQDFLKKFFTDRKKESKK